MTEPDSSPRPALRIETSRTDSIWNFPAWKCLINALSASGSEANPIHACPEMQAPLADWIKPVGNRSHSKRETPLSTVDDSALRNILIRRVSPGDESISVGVEPLPDVTGWPVVEFPYLPPALRAVWLRRCGDSIRELLKVFSTPPDRFRLELAFRLSTARRRKERDLDKLADAILNILQFDDSAMDELRLYKLDPTKVNCETLRFRCTVSPAPTGRGSG